MPEERIQRARSRSDRSVRDEFVDSVRPPTSSLVQVAGLFRPDILIEIEIEAVAAVASA